MTRTSDHLIADRQRVARVTTWVSIGVNVLLTAMQLAIGLFARSQALVADAIHTLSDVVSDIVVLIANRHSHAAPDEDHHYGHARYETVASLWLGVLLFVVGVGMLWRAGERLALGGAGPTVHVAALWAALITLAGKEGLFRYMLREAERVRSSMLVANAWHARADAASSLVVAAGIGGNLLGYTFLDALAAAIVGFLIAHMGWKFAWGSLQVLTDRALDPEEVDAIRNTLSDTPGVLDVHELRTRKMGDLALVDAHLLVPPTLSVSEGHFIAERARHRVLDRHAVLDVLVHVDPEDDKNTPSAAALPDRTQLQRDLEAALSGAHAHPRRLIPHYLGGKVDLDVFFDPLNETQRDELQALLAEFKTQTPAIRTIRLHETHALDHPAD